MTKATEEADHTLAATGAVTDHSARLWFRIADGAPSDYQLRLRCGDAAVAQVSLDRAQRIADDVFVLRVPSDVPGLDRLAEKTRYHYALTTASSDVPLQEGRFDTAPSHSELPKEPFSFAVMSCHQPFASDGSVDPAALGMLRALPTVLEEENVKRVLLVGDQMYTDLPESISLFNGEFFQSVAPADRAHILECSPQEVRQLLQQRYRRAWAVADFEQVQRLWPTYQMPDDHEFVDNFGSDRAHSSPEWESFRQGAVQAAYDYELSLVVDTPEPPYDYGFRYGPIATFVMDLRTQKHATDDKIEMFAEQQLDTLERFLGENADAAVVFVVLTVPLYHVPDWAGKLGEVALPEGSDFDDRWSNPRVQGSRRALLERLLRHKRAHPHQLMALLGGDVHVSLAAELRFAELEAPIYQFTASPLSNASSGMKALLAKLFSKLRLHPISHASGEPDASVLPGEKAFDANPFGELNVGIVSFEPAQQGIATRFKFYTFDPEHPGRGKLVYCSPAIHTPYR